MLILTPSVHTHSDLVFVVGVKLSSLHTSPLQPSDTTEASVGLGEHKQRRNYTSTD